MEGDGEEQCELIEVSDGVSEAEAGEAGESVSVGVLGATADSKESEAEAGESVSVSALGATDNGKDGENVNAVRRFMRVIEGMFSQGL